jgi:hypothetical protein
MGWERAPGRPSKSVRYLPRLLRNYLEAFAEQHRFAHGPYGVTIIQAGRAVDSFVAPTHFRPEFFNSLYQMQTLKIRPNHGRKGYSSPAVLN